MPPDRVFLDMAIEHKVPKLDTPPGQGSGELLYIDLKNANKIREFFLPPGCSERVVKYLEKLNYSTSQSVINKQS